MNSYVLMLQADPDDQDLTAASIAEINPGLEIKYLSRPDELDNYIRDNGQPSIILLNDHGTITERGQVLRRLKANTAYGHIPVVVLGEKSSPDYVKECYKAGASTFITKPSSLKATHKKIETFFSYWAEVAEV